MLLFLTAMWQNDKKQVKITKKMRGLKARSLPKDFKFSIFLTRVPLCFYLKVKNIVFFTQFSEKHVSDLNALNRIRHMFAFLSKFNQNIKKSLFDI